MFLNPFRSRIPPENAWFPVGRASSFPEVGVSKDEEQPKLCSLMNTAHNSNNSDEATNSTQHVPCKVFHVPRTDPTQRTEVELPIEEGSQDMTDQVLVFKFRGKIHAIDHVSDCLFGFSLQTMRETNGSPHAAMSALLLPAIPGYSV